MKWEAKNNMQPSFPHRSYLDLPNVYTAIYLYDHENIYTVCNQ